MSEMEKLYWFEAKPERVVDGDTMDVIVDLGFRAHRSIRVRLIGVDTNEIFGVHKETEEYKKGIEHAEAVREWMKEAVGSGDEWPLILWSKGERSFDRWECEIFRKLDHESLGDHLIDRYPKVESEQE